MDIIDVCFLIKRESSDDILQLQNTNFMSHIISSKMSRCTRINPLSLNQTLLKLESFFRELNTAQTIAQLKLKFSIAPILALPRQLLNTALLFLIRIRFPLLLKAQEEQQMHLYGQKLKELYQKQLQNDTLKTQFNFDYFLVVIAKLCRKFITKTFQSLIVEKQAQAELYCLLIKGLLGINLSVSSYRHLQKKFIDQEKYSKKDFQSTIVQSHPNTANVSYTGTKRIITLNSIQTKLHKRKMKKKHQAERSSLNMFDSQGELAKFKQDLNTFLKTKPQNIKQENLRYKSMQKQILNGQQFPKFQRRKENKLKTQRAVIHTQQISTSLKMNLLMKNIQHSYSRRDVSLRHSSPQPRFFYNLYETGFAKKTQLLKNNEEYIQIRASQRLSVKIPQIILKKKNKAYWDKMKENLQTINNSFIF